MQTLSAAQWVKFGGTGYDAPIQPFILEKKHPVLFPHNGQCFESDVLSLVIAAFAAVKQCLRNNASLSSARTKAALVTL